MPIKNLAFWLLTTISLLSASIVKAEELSKVTILNYIEAKTSLHFERVLAKGDSFNQWLHNRGLAPITEKPQSSRRINRDTIYSYAIVNIQDGASFNLPESGGRYFSVQVINQNHFTNRTFNTPGGHNLTMGEFDTPYVLLLARILVDPSDPIDVQNVHALQDRLSLQSNNSTPYHPKKFDLSSLRKISATLLSLADDLPDANACFGSKNEVDPVRHLLATAYGWGGLPDVQASYKNVQPDRPIGAYALRLKDVPVDGFWSISVYNKDGFFEKNSRDLYSINSLTAIADEDGAYTIRFGGDPNAANYLPITEGWNYVIRLYRPHQSVLDRTWAYPSLQTL